MPELALYRKNGLIAAIDMACRQLELTQSQYEEARKRYSRIATHLSESNDPLFEGVEIRPQGSVRLRTTVRPVGKNEFDVDLLCHLPAANQYLHDSDNVYQLIGTRLKEHGIYERMCKPQKRCWRLQYADGEQFHMDITPSIRNLACFNGGILVPDRQLHDWEPSNPLGYADMFDTASKKIPTFTAFNRTQFAKAMASAYIEPMPERMESTDLLRRFVQVCKRHRDLLFQKESGFPPISIIITTLVMHAYEEAILHPHETPWDFMIDVVRRMPNYIKVTQTAKNRHEFNLPNPTTEGENFAERWNEDIRRAQDFWRWHKSLTAALTTLLALKGEDRIQEHLTGQITGPETVKSFSRRRDIINSARAQNQLNRIGGSGGLVVTQSGSPGIRSHTFYGS